MSIKDLALVKLVSGAVKKGKDVVNTVLKSGKSVSNEESVMDTLNLAIGKNKKVTDRVEAESALAKTVVKKESAKPATKKETTKPVVKKESAKPAAKEEATKPVVKKESTKPTAVKKDSAKKDVSKKDVKIALYKKDIEKHLGSVDNAFLEIIVKNLGPSIYRKDAESVACTDPKELDTVRNNFLVKKLGFSKDDKEMLDGEIKKVCESMKGTKIKYRATFYYTLAKNLKKESALS